jgi:hypothetical protein
MSQVRFLSALQWIGGSALRGKRIKYIPVWQKLEIRRIAILEASETIVVEVLPLNGKKVNLMNEPYKQSHLSNIF